MTFGLFTGEIHLIPHAFISEKAYIVVVVVALLFYVHGKHLGHVSQLNHTFPGQA